MTTNLFFLLLFLLLTLSAGGLTLKAVRAPKLWVKIVGGLLAGALTLVLGAVTFAGGKGIAYMYFSNPAPAPELTVAGTSEQIARGEYLAGIGCIGCHGTYTGATFEGTPTFPLKGGNDIGAVEEDLPPIGQLITENLTPGGKLAGYTDGELFRSIRHGVDQDGHMLAFMPLLPFGGMSDADIEAIIAYLRSQPAVAPTGPTGTEINFLGMLLFGAGMFPAATAQPDRITAPVPGANAEYGKYVATFGECRGCHGPQMTGAPATQFTLEVPNPRPLVGTLTAEEFIEMMRTGVRPGNKPFPDTMPWQNAAAMNDEDLAALFVYMTTEP